MRIIMVNKCIVCGRYFKASRWNQQVCSDECMKVRQKAICAKHKSQIPKRPKPKPKPIIKSDRSKITVLDNDPEWIKKYAKADRLTQISMLAVALSDYGIIKISYGQLSTKWDTAEYFKWESTVISKKRKE